MTQTVFQQATTGVLHLSENCSVTRRTRYRHFELDVVDGTPKEYSLQISREQVANTPHCHKCWDGAKPPTKEA